MFETSAQQRPYNPHQQFIEERIPDWLTRASPDRRLALKRTPVAIPQWYKTASAASHAALALAIKASWVSQNKVDRLFESLANVRQFAEPLLRQALKERFAIEVDVTRTYLRLYLPTGILVGYQVRTVSLLDAALRNFEAKEAGIRYFDSASCFISEPSMSGQFDVLAINQHMSVSAFVSMCRELDIGGQYTQQLETLLLPKDALARAVLELNVKTSQKDAFRAAILLARMKGDIGLHSHASLLHLLDGGARPALGARVLQCYQLQVMEAKLTGIMLLAGDLDRATRVEPVLVYIPDDPQHPLKEYPSTAAFRADLAQRLRSAHYQRFFARFVAHERRGYFFAALNDPSTVMKWSSRRVQGDPWTELYQDKLNKILNDARAIAVPCADTDRNSRWETWDSLEKVASIVLQVAALVAVPFVPFLGELMLAYTAYQLLDETCTGILDWTEGQVVEAADHLMAIAENLAQLGAFAVGGAVAGKVLAIKPSTFVDSLKPVVLEDGRTRLWNPDLTPYEFAASLPADSMPDELGLHHHGAAMFLPLEGSLYEVRTEPGESAWRVRHPQRANAYRPRLTHNGAGAWAHEVERPMEWQGAQLFRRLGHSVAEFSDVTARRILDVSGVDEAVLRDMHVHVRRPPALLEESIRRFGLDEQIKVFRAQLQSPDPAVYTKADPQMQALLLQAQGVRVPESLRNANGIQGIVESLDEATLKKLLGESTAFGDSLPAIDVRKARLRSRMADWAEEHRGALFQAREDAFEQRADADTQQLRRIFPDLPKTIAQELSRNASATDRLHMRNHPGITQRMAHEALFYLREVRLSRACEGLYLDSVSSLDSDRLALHMLETLNGWSADVRIEMRDKRFDGALLDSIGRPEAPLRKVLVRQGGRYQAHDNVGEQLHGFDTLYGAVMHALPDTQRLSLGLPHVGQWAELKQMLRRQPLLDRALVRALFKQPALGPAVRSPMGLAVGRSGYLLGGGDLDPAQTQSIEQRLRALYPTLSEEQMAALRSERLTGDPLLAVARLENEHITLVNELEVWSADVPSIHPGTGALLTDAEIAIQRQHRQGFMQALLDTATRYITTLEFELDFLGVLPELSADFSHVRELSLSSSSRTGGHAFFASFPGVRYLTLSGLALEAFPVELYQMRELVSLTLDDCDIRLTEATVEGLAHIEGLTLLDLENNPLEWAPHVGYMKQLDSLYLKNTGLTTVPYGMFSLESLAFVDLTFNEITMLPDELFEVSDTRDANYNFRNNPLSDLSKQQVADYMENAGADRKLLIQVDDEFGAEQAEDTESEAEDSGVESAGDDD